MAQDSTTEKLIKEGQELVKWLGTLPPNKLTPTLLALEAKKIAKENKLKITVLGEKDMRKYGMGGVLAVSQGSNEEARGIILDYNPRSAKKVIALVGKGVTFDSGGLSLKSPKNLHEMKYDMLGGATVLAILQAASRLKIPHRIICAIFATENLPSGNATRPGDVISLYNGKTVEVLNTDAEGRLLLADSITYVQKKFSPTIIIDIATLSHGITQVLGDKISGAFGTDKYYNNLLTVASKEAEERLHFLPLCEEYMPELMSPVADLRNVSSLFRFDTMLGALFLKQFVAKNTPWIHVDIAGTAYTKNGPTATMVRTLLKFLQKL